MDIAGRLKQIRTAKGYSVYKLSQLSGVSETHIRDLERGDRNPSLDTIDLTDDDKKKVRDWFNEGKTEAEEKNKEW